MKFNFNPIKKLVTGAAIFAASHTNAAEKPEMKPAENVKENTIENIETSTSSQNNAEVVNFTAEREARIRSLEKSKTALEASIQRLSGQLQSLQSDFQNNYQDALSFTGEKPKAKFEGFETRLADIVKKYAEDRVGKEDITSPAALNTVLGIVLSREDGPLKKESAHLNTMAEGQLGSAVMLATNKPGKYESPDMHIHKHLGEDPKFIAQTTLNIVQQSHDLELVIEELNNLLNVPPEIIAQN